MKLTIEHIETYFEYYQDLSEKIKNSANSNNEQFQKELDKATGNFDTDYPPKGAILLNYGEIQNKIIMLIEGVVVSKYKYPIFRSEKDYKEYTSNIYYNSKKRPEQPQVVINHESFFYGKKSTETIEAIEDSVIVTIDKEKLEEVFRKDDVLMKKSLNFETSSYMNLTKRMRDLQSLDKKDLINKFLNEHSEVLNINKKHIFSYLGIGRDTFYRYYKSRNIKK